MTTPRPDAAKLRECPFCGAPAKKYCGFATCSNQECKMHFGLVPDMHTFKQWNRRTPSPVEVELREALRWLHDWCDDNVTDPAVTIPLHKARAALAKGGGK